jgi:hypothetical protein
MICDRTLKRGSSHSATRASRSAPVTSPDAIMGSRSWAKVRARTFSNA